MDDEDELTLRTYDDQTAMVAYWIHRLGEEAPDLDRDPLRRALLEACGAGWRMAEFVHEVPNPSRRSLLRARR